MKRIERYKNIKKIKSFTIGDITVVVHQIKIQFEILEVFAQAWKNGKQLGFGPDGSVDIERFRFFNMPALVPTGEIVDGLSDSFIETKKSFIRRKNIYKDSPLEAIQNALVDTIKIVGKENSNIEEGKIGNTTSTFYPDPHTETVSVDGRVYRTASSNTWASMRGGTGNGHDDATSPLNGPLLEASATANRWSTLVRSLFVFDTSAIPDGNTITSATFSVTCTGKADPFNGQVGITEGACASNTDLVNADFQSNESLTTRWCDTDIAISAISTTGSTYNNWSLNASGIAGISKTGVTKIGLKLNHDIDNTEPTYSTSASEFITVNHSENSGTSADPKLVVEHSSASAFVPKVNWFL